MFTDQLIIKISFDELYNSENNKTNHTSLWGSIFFKCSENYFPCYDWYDCISSVLDLWTSALVECIKQNDRNCRLYFMDGPYYADLLFYDEQVSISFFQNDQASIPTVHTPVCSFIQKIVNGCLQLLRNVYLSYSSLENNSVLSRIQTNCNALEMWVRYRTGDGLREPY